MLREGAPILHFDSAPETRSLYKFAGLSDPFQRATQDAPAVESLLNIEDAPQVETYFGCPTFVLFPTYGEPHQIEMQIRALGVLNDYMLYEFPHRPPINLLFVEGGQNSKAGDEYESLVLLKEFTGVNIFREGSIEDFLPTGYRFATDTGGELDYLRYAREMIERGRPGPVAHALVLGMAPHMLGISKLIKGKRLKGVTPLSVEGVLYALYPELLYKYMDLEEYRSTEAAFRKGEVTKSFIRELDRTGRLLTWLSSTDYKSALHKMVHGL